MTKEDFLALYYVWQQRTLPAELKGNAKALCEQGLLAKLGRGKYRLPDLYQNLPSQDGIAVRPIPRTDDECKADILTYIQGHSKQGIALAELLEVIPSRNLRQIRHLVECLRKEGSIMVKGAGRGARWFLVK